MSVAGESTQSNPFSERHFYAFLNDVGNHELKLLTGALILSNPDVVYTGTSLHHTFLERQGDPPLWKFQASTLTQYCEQSLRPNGAVVISKVTGERGKMVNGYQASKEHREQKLALAGSLLGWSLDYPDVSLQQVLGTAKSNTRVRAPEVRHQIYMSLLTGEEGGNITSYFEVLERLGYRGQTNMNFQLTRMRELGLIELGTSVGQNPTVTAKPIEDGALPSKLEEDSDHQRSIVKLGTEKAASITDLCKRLEDVKDGAVAGKIRVAQQIIASTPDFRSLVLKARQFSHTVAGRNSGREELEN